MENENIGSFEDENLGLQNNEFKRLARKLKTIGVLHYMVLELE